MATPYKTKKGKDITLLTPSEKGFKFAREIKTGERLTNAGQPKLDENGKPIKIGKKTTRDLQARAYRAGYLDAQKDSAKAFKKKNPNYIRKTK